VDDLLSAIQTVTLSTYILMTMLAIGMKLSVSEMARSLKRTRLIAAALVVNIIIVPAAAWAALRLFDDLPTASVIAVVLLASTPGYAPIMSDRARGDMAYSTTLIFVLSIVAIVTIPVLTTILFSSESTVEVDGWAILATLVAYQLLPLGLGMTVRRVREPIAERLAPRVGNAGIILVGIAVLTYAIDVLGAAGNPLIDLGWQVFAVWVVITAIALAAGYSAGGPEEATRRTLSLHTAIRNGGLTLLIAATSFPDMGAEIGIIALVVVMYPMAMLLTIRWSQQPIAADDVGT